MKVEDLRGYDLLRVGTIALAQIELNGIRIDTVKAKEKIAETEKRISDLIESVKSDADVKKWQKKYNRSFDVNSVKVLREFFFDYIGFKSEKLTKGGNLSVDKEVIEGIDHPVANMITEIRKLEKMKTYYKNILEHTSPDGYLHPFFHLNSTVSYRSSSSNINFQNIPIRDESMKSIRELFLPSPGNVILEFDYSGIEVRVAACYTEDPNLIRYVSDPTTDMHRDVTAQIFKIPPEDVPKNLRRMIKGGFTFAQFYGSYWKPCAEYIWKDINENEYMIGDTPLDEHLKKFGLYDFDNFADHIKEIEADFWGNRFRRYAQWKQEIWDFYVKNGYIESLTGFRYTGYMKKNAVTNYPIQGSAFHILLWSLIHLQKLFQEKKLKSKIVGQIHDSIVMDIEPSELDFIIKAIKKIAVETVPKVWEWIIVPLEVEIEVTGVNEPWSEKKPI